MTVKIRSSAGNIDSSDFNPEVDSPATITAGDLLVIIFVHLTDGDPGSGITPPSGFTLEDEVSNASVATNDGSRYLVYTKVADGTDVTNAGTADYYVFSGMTDFDDTMYAIFSLYDDGGGDVEYVASSLAGNYETGGGTTTSAPTQTISTDGSLVISAWTAHEGTNYFYINASLSYTPTGGANSATPSTGWAADLINQREWVVGHAEFDIADSPIGAQTISHLSLASNVDTYSCSMVFQIAAAAGGAIPPIHHHRQLIGAV